MTFLCGLIGHDYILKSHDSMTRKRWLNTYVCERCLLVKKEIVEEVKFYKTISIMKSHS